MGRESFSFKSQFAAALEEGGNLSLFLLCRNADLMALVKLVLRDDRGKLEEDEQYQAEKKRPGNWPHLISKGVDALAGKAGWRAGLEGVAKQLDIKWSKKCSDGELADKVASVFPSSGPGVEMSDPRLKSNKDVAEVACEIARLRHTLRLRLKLPEENYTKSDPPVVPPPSKPDPDGRFAKIKSAVWGGVDLAKGRLSRLLQFRSRSSSS